MDPAAFPSPRLQTAGTAPLPDPWFPVAERKSSYMPLSFAKPGDVCKVIRVGGNATVRSHLENLGITLGAAITVVQSTPSGIIVNIRDSRVAISKEMASKIFVE